MADQPLIPEETRQMIGELLSEPLTATITAKEAQRFAMASDDLNPLYLDDGAARAAGYPCTLVPPVFLAWALAHARPPGEVRQDGL